MRIKYSLSELKKLNEANIDKPHFTLGELENDLVYLNGANTFISIRELVENIALNYYYIENIETLLHYVTFKRELTPTEIAQKVNILLHKDVLYNKYVSELDLNDDQKELIKLGLEQGLDVSKYADEVYDYWQMCRIYDGLEERLDVSLYANPSYTSDEMYEIYDGLLKGLDVSIYTKNTYSSQQMNIIKLGLERNLDIFTYLDNNLSADQMEQIYLGLRDGVDVTLYNSIQFSKMKMNIIRLSLKHNLNVLQYLNSSDTEVVFLMVSKYMKQETNSFKIKKYVEKLRKEALERKE